MRNTHTHILAMPNLSSFPLTNYPPRCSLVLHSSVTLRTTLSTKKDTSGWCGGSVASQRRVHHNRTSALVGEVDCNLRATISCSLNTDIGGSRSLILTDFVVSIDKDTRIGVVIADREVIGLVGTTTAKAILVSHGSG